MYFCSLWSTLHGSLTRFLFVQAKISIQLIAPDKMTKQSRDLVFVYVFIHNTSKSRLNSISRLKEPQRVCTTQLIRIHSPPGFSLPVATLINQSAPNFLCLIFLPWKHAVTKHEVNYFSKRSRDHSCGKWLTHFSLYSYRNFSFYFLCL